MIQGFANDIDLIRKKFGAIRAAKRYCKNVIQRMACSTLLSVTAPVPIHTERVDFYLVTGSELGFSIGRGKLNFARPLKALAWVIEFRKRQIL